MNQVYQHTLKIAKDIYAANFEAKEDDYKSMSREGLENKLSNLQCEKDALSFSFINPNDSAYIDGIVIPMLEKEIKIIEGVINEL